MQGTTVLFKSYDIFCRIDWWVVSIVSKVRKGKGKDKYTIDPKTRHEGPEGEQSYSSTLSLTMTPDVVGGQRHAPTASPAGKRTGWYPFYRRLAGSQGRSGWVWKIVSPPGFDPQTV
jgi:hypothetical protein